MTALRLALVLLFVGVPGNLAHASCNTIPERPVFLGERGSIDRPFVSPDPDERVTLRAPRESLGLKDSLITIIFKPPAETPRTFFIAPTEHDCEKLEEPVCCLERLFCHPHRTCVTGAAFGLTAESSLSQLSFRFPEVDAAGPVTIAVTRSDRPPVHLQRQTCSAFITAAKESPNESDPVVCIDKLRALPGDDPPGDPTFTQLVALPPSYDYSTVCTHYLGDPKCSGSANDVSYTVDSQGDVSMSLIWANILRRKSTAQEFYQRVLGASTAVEAVLGQDNRIFIPSPVFLQTTTQQGGGFSPSPVFIPAELPERPNEQTFSGTADKGKSVLKFGRRKLWSYTCDAGANQAQACEPDSASLDCPSAQCKSSLPTPGEYFACAGGSRDRLPCTRTAHCPQGKCLRVSETGSVCYSLSGTLVNPEKACKQDSDCGKDAECGPGLFEFRNRTVNGVGTLKRIATNTRGVCESGLKEGNSCTTASACTSSLFGSEKCVTYRAAALSSSGPTP